MSPSRTVLIAGAGIGGLAAAIALADAGYRVIVFERDETPDTSGAGIQLSPNATRALASLGALDLLASRAAEPERLLVANALSGATLAVMTLGKVMREKFGAPYLVCLRADLHEVLHRIASTRPEIELRFGSAVTDFSASGSGARANLLTGGKTEDIEGDALIGADGIRSVVRAQLDRGSAARHGGMSAWRATIPADALPANVEQPESVRVWLGPGAHLVHYPVGNGGEINLVAVTTDSEPTASWGEARSGTELFPYFQDWHAAPRAVLAAADAFRRWSIFEAPLMPRWAEGPVALLGDAAHGMFPFVAQGAATALEDAVALGSAMRNAGDVPEALQAYERLRKPRATQIQSAARNIGRIYHMPRPFGFGRDLVMKQIGGEGLMRQNAWIYRG